MNRKVIELGHDCMVISLPRKWIKNNNVKKGDELAVEEDDSSLKLSFSQRKVSREINLNVQETTESGLRTLLVNAYRIGYDKIIINYEGKKENIVNVVENYMLGFEVFTVGNRQYTLENVAEPNVADFDKILLKQFQILSEILHNLEGNIEEDVYRVRKYDNFLKRCLNKNLLYTKEKGFLWQFQSSLVHIASECLHLKEDVKKKMKLTKEESAMIATLTEMLKTLELGYLKKDVGILLEMHSIERKKVFDKIKQHLIKQPLAAYHFLIIARMILLATSPLTGLIQSRELLAK